MLAAQPVDFRKSVHTLSALVSEALRANPYCGDVFVFRSKRMDRVKLLAWDGSGMVLVTKWLHQGRFTWPPIRDGVVHLSATQLAMLLAGRLQPGLLERIWVFQISLRYDRATKRSIAVYQFRTFLIVPSPSGCIAVG